VIEALACGLPVVTSTGCGARDAVHRLDPALVRDARDIDGLAGAINRALELATKLTTIERTRAIASEYDMGRMIERTIAVHDAISRARQP
jgi:UDP-glucose:(heptosyl)LPS alpha-1,3-glucosyltransferase